MGFLFINRKPAVTANENETIRFKWEDIVDVTVEGYENTTTVTLEYKEIPELETRVIKEKEKAKNIRMEATKTQNFEGLDELEK